MDYDTKNDVINEKGQGKIFMIYEQKKKKTTKKPVCGMLAYNYKKKKKKNHTLEKFTDQEKLSLLDLF